MVARMDNISSWPSRMIRWRKKHEITSEGGCPEPVLTFREAVIPNGVMAVIKKSGFVEPSIIQASAWPAANMGRDLVGVAKTGSGKTLGFLIPAFNHVSKLRHIDLRVGPIVLILAPTRELAQQIREECNKFGKGERLYSTCVYGGAPRGPQLMALRKGIHLVIATPGRLNDYLEHGNVSLKQISYLVLDEADRMLDMGFEPQIRQILAYVPPRRQTLFFSATWPKEVRRLANEFLQKPIVIHIGDTKNPVANKDVTQVVNIITNMSQKNRLLQQILHKEGDGARIIIFCGTKRMCNTLELLLKTRLKCATIHGDKNQWQRERVLKNFKTGLVPVMIATDVAGRGVDVKDVRAVVNYDFPQSVEDYVHRIGRTGRAGAKGNAYTFMDQQNGKKAASLIEVMEASGQYVSRELRDLARTCGRPWNNKAHIFYTYSDDDDAVDNNKSNTFSATGHKARGDYRMRNRGRQDGKDGPRNNYRNKNKYSEVDKGNNHRNRHVYDEKKGGYHRDRKKYHWNSDAINIGDSGNLDGGTNGGRYSGASTKYRTTIDNKDRGTYAHKGGRDQQNRSKYYGTKGNRGDQDGRNDQGGSFTSVSTSTHPNVLNKRKRRSRSRDRDYDHDRVRNNDRSNNRKFDRNRDRDRDRDSGDRNPRDHRNNDVRDRDVRDRDVRDRDVRDRDVRDRDVRDRDVRDREAREAHDRELRNRELLDRNLRDRNIRDRNIRGNNPDRTQRRRSISPSKNLNNNKRRQQYIQNEDKYKDKNKRRRIKDADNDKARASNNSSIDAASTSGRDTKISKINTNDRWRSEKSKSRSWSRDRSRRSRSYSRDNHRRKIKEKKQSRTYDNNAKVSGRKIRNKSRSPSPISSSTKRKSSPSRNFKSSPKKFKPRNSRYYFKS